MNMQSENRILDRKAFRVLEALMVLGVIVMITYANYLIFLVVPNERLMGPVQRIFYFHVGSALACYAAFGIVFVGSIWHLINRSWTADAVAEAAGEVGFVFCTIVLATGMIWGKAAWNTWFSWEPRLVTFLLLWLIFLAFNLLRAFGEPSKVAAQSAVLGIIGVIMIPFVIFSVKFMPQTAQLHPQVIENSGLKEPIFAYTLAVTAAALILLQFLLVWVRARIGFRKLNGVLNG